MTTANWIKQTTVTTGTGTITLGAADTGFVGVGDWFADGDNVHYFIEDSDSGNREEGRGVFASGAGTITRGEVIATVTAGTLATYPAGGLALVGPSTVGINSSASLSLGSGTQFPYKASRDYDLPDNCIQYNRTTTTAAANELYLYPAVILFRRRITNFHINVTTGIATKLAYIGVWDQQVNGNPGNVLFDSGPIDVATSGVKTAAVSPELVLNPGVYWFGFICDDAGVLGKGFTASDGSIAGGFGGVDSLGQNRRRVGSIVSPTIPFASNLTVTTGSSDHVIGVLFS